MTRHRFSDKTWETLYEALHLISGIYIGQEAKVRAFVEGVHWIMRTGAPWRDLPPEFGKANSVFKRFARWADKGIWDQLHENLIEEADMEWLMLDSTVVRAHPCAAGAPHKNGGQAEQDLGRSVGGFSSKIHAVVDGLGNPLRIILTAGQKGDAPQAIPLLQEFEFEAVLADRGYDSDAIIEFIEANDGEAVIPSKKNRLVQRETDWALYKARHLVECFFNKLKHYRRIFARFDKYASRYKAFLSFASALIWAK